MYKALEAKSMQGTKQVKHREHMACEAQEHVKHKAHEALEHVGHVIQHTQEFIMALLMLIWLCWKKQLIISNGV